MPLEKDFLNKMQEAQTIKDRVGKGNYIKHSKNKKPNLALGKDIVKPASKICVQNM